MSTSAFNQTGVDLPDPEPVEEVGAEAPDRPSWLPSNFRDEEAFAQSYKELERKLEGLSRDKEEAEEYARAMAEQLEYAQQQPVYQQPDVENNPLVSQWEQALEMGDAKTQLALAAYVASQIADQKIAQAQAPTEETSVATQAQAGIFARVVDQDVQAAYEGKYNEPWQDIRGRVGDFLNDNPHWLEGVSDADQAVYRIAQAADFVRTQGDQQERVGNPQRTSAQQKYLGQTLQGHGARAQAAKDAASELVERMKSIQGPYGYSG